MDKKIDKKQQATFIVKILNCENGTWQGKIIYAEENRTRYFRSMLEMLKLMDEAASGSGQYIMMASNK